MMLRSRFTTSICRQDLEDYVRIVEIDVLCYDEDVADAYLVGRITLNQILWAQAIVDGESLFEVCDNDSQGLHNIFMILTKGKTEFRKDLNLEEVAQEVIFLHRFLLHPDFRPHHLGVLDAALKLFSEESLAVMWMGESNLTEAELAKLGFAKIAGSDLIYRRSWYRSPFSDENPRGLDCHLEARPDHEEWVSQEWKQLVGLGSYEGDEL